MSPLRVVAMDDEPLALRRLEWCLQDAPDIELVGRTSDPRHGLALIRSLAPDVVLLDVDMPELGGFELIEALADGPTPEIIFVTAFDHFAVRAFAASVVDYLLKPVEQQRLLQALERARTRCEGRDARARIAELREIVDNLRADSRRTDRGAYETELWIREGDARVRIPVEMIERLEADGDYVRLHIGQRVRLMRARLGDLAERLDPDYFVRIHRSEIVRHDLVAAIRRCESGRAFAVLSGGREIPISRRYLSQIGRALRLSKRGSGDKSA
jgi:two-component system, LytTR family, response regulator